MSFATREVHVTKSSTGLRFPAWSGTGGELEETIRALQENVLPDGVLSVSIRPFLAAERATSVSDLMHALPKKEAFQIVVRVEGPEHRTLVLVLGPNLPDSGRVKEEGSEEDLLPGNIISAQADSRIEADRLAHRALDVVGGGIPPWGPWKEQGHMNILRLENLAGLGLIAVGFIASLIVVWPLGWFFGLFVGLVLLLIGLEVVEKLFPPFEIHGGQPSWRRRWWLAALLIGVPIGTAILLRIFLGPWDGTS